MGVSSNQQPNYDFEKAWKEVKNHLDKGLPKTALNKVEEIQRVAIEYDVRPQIIKSSVFITKLLINTEEKGIEAAIEKLEIIVQQQKSPVDRVISAYLAEMYNNYFNFNRWTISQRTEFDTNNSNDFRTWTSQQFLKKIEKLYIYALEDPKNLDFPIETYKDILEDFDKEGVLLKPTLYEVVLDNALKYFENAAYNYPISNQEFEIDNNIYFAKANNFANSTINPLNPDSPKYKILALYKDVISRQIKSNANVAQAAYDLSRLNYVYNNTTLIDKDSLYEEALVLLAQEHKNIPFVTEIMADLAEFTLNKHNDPERNIRALKLCNEAIGLYPQSVGAHKCQNIIHSIKKPFIEAYIEKVYGTTQHIIWALDYNNVEELDFYIVKLDNTWDALIRESNNDKLYKYLSNLPTLRNGKKKLLPSDNFTVQRAEYLEKPMDVGKYALILKGSNEKEFFKYVIFHVSDLSWTSYDFKDNQYLNIVDRTSGKPLSGVSVKISENIYNPSARRSDKVYTETFQSDKKGRVRIKYNKNRRYSFLLQKGKDILDLNTSIYSYYNQHEKRNRMAEFYTDRSIYRPGQVVHFKAILMETNENDIPAIIKNTSCEVILKDANYQEIAKLPLTSNNFGSVSGSFVIPVGKLTGNFTLELQGTEGLSGFANFNVEEYKRPSFEVVANPVEGSYKLSHVVKVTGKAQTLAGSHVDDADVSFKVVRTARFPFWSHWWRTPFQSQELIITQGKTKSNESGEFDLEFIALPDKTISPDDKPVFIYRVEIDVTDQRGETRSTQSHVSVGYQMLEIKLNVPQEYDISQSQKWFISTQNLQGSQLNSKGEISIFKLKEPKNVQLSKYWAGPIQSPLSQEDLKFLPHFPTQDTYPFDKWDIESKVHSQQWVSGDSLDIPLKAGVYKIVSQCQDQAGNTISVEKFTVVTDIFNKNLPKNKFLHTYIHKYQYEIGETFTMKLASRDKIIYAHIVVENGQKKIFDEILKVSKATNISLPIEEYMRGGFSVVVSYVIENRVFIEKYRISVPWTNKQLSVKFESFRNKTLPGSQEEYRILIEGPNKDRVMAEMVATMYDASLDQFKSHLWKHSYYPEYFGTLRMEAGGFRQEMFSTLISFKYEGVPVNPINVPKLVPLDYHDFYGVSVRGVRSGNPEVMMSKSMNFNEDSAMENPGALENVEAIEYQTPLTSIENEEQKNTSESSVTARKNLKETVFFLSNLLTDDQGRIVLNFTMNEALTRWRFMSLVHTEDFKVGFDERTVQTQKDIMVFPNTPRFVRDGDKITFSGKVSNLSTTDQTINVRLQLWDAIQMKDITQDLIKSQVSYTIDVEQGRSGGIFWDLEIPDRYLDVLTYKMIAETKTHSDAEENSLPVLTDRIMVTETMPIWIQGNETKLFHFNKFKNNNSPSKKDYKYTFEYTAHPVWYAIQALPYMQEETNSTSMALIQSLYANVLAEKIALAHPKIKAVFDQWMTKDKEALLSQLNKNEELKGAILEETPWVRQALSEEEQKRNIALLFDLTKMASDREKKIEQLKIRQLPNGGFPWLSQGRDNIYVTHNIMENIGHLYQLEALDINDPELENIVRKSLIYMDEELVERYEKLKKNVLKNNGNLNGDHLDEITIMYLYVRSFFKHVQPAKNTAEARKYYLNQCEKYWLNRSVFGQAMIGFFLKRMGNKTAQDIYKSLDEKSTRHTEMGMYWNVGNGYAWYQLPIERHAMLLEFFNEMNAPTQDLNAMKLWLLKNKQTTHWKTSKATASALYALLIQGEKAGISPWIVESIQPVILVGEELINTSVRDSESGTGYVKKSWEGSDITKEKGFIKITNNNSSVAWGAAYYQYFEQLDKITSFEETPLKINKSTFRVESTKWGDNLVSITDEAALTPGEKLMVRIEIRVDRDMEFVHMKDMRAGGTEPINVLSEYKYQGGLSYYETTKDIATHFYFSYLSKGTYVFEYPLRVVHKGDFSSGITTIQSLYAPEFSSHSAGGRLIIK